MQDILKQPKIPTKDKDKPVFAINLLKDLQKFNEFRSEGWFYEGYYLYWLKKDDLWKYAHGEGVSSWNAFLSSIGIDVNTAFYKFNAYDFFIIKNGFSLKDITNIDVKKIRSIFIHAKNQGKKEVSELLDKARELSYSDFMAEITNKEPCLHNNCEAKDEHILICKDCGRKLKNGS